MSWEEISAIGNLIGGVAVVVSIIFLAIEVRHNTASNRLATEKDIANAITTQIFLSTAATRLPYIYLRGTEDPSQLSEEEEGQFTFYVMGFLRLVQDAYDRYQEGNISERTWESIELLLMAHLSSDGMRAVWDVRSNTFKEEFRAYVNQLEIKDGLLPPAEATRAIIHGRNYADS